MAEVDKDQDQCAYREGLFVRALGRARSSNPYRPNSEEGVLWEKGWRLIDTRREDDPPPDTAFRPIKSVPEFTPGVASANARHDQLGPPTAAWSSLVRIVHVILTLALVGLLLGMVIAMSR
jgi:hypothetical protein